MIREQCLAVLILKKGSLQSILYPRIIHLLGKIINYFHDNSKNIPFIIILSISINSRRGHKRSHLSTQEAFLTLKLADDLFKDHKA